MAKSSQEVRDLIDNTKVALTKKKPTQTAVEVTSKLGERLQRRIADRMSGTAKTVSSANRSIDLSLSGLTQQIGLTAAAETLKQNAIQTARQVGSSLVKGKTAEATNILKSKVAQLAGTGLLGTGESAINDKLADTIATTGPTDALLTQDVYGDVSGSGILTGFKGKIADLTRDIGNQLRGGGGLAANLANVLRVGAGGSIGIDTNVLKDRLVWAVGGKQGLINGLTGAVKQGMLDGTSIDPGLLNRIEVVVNNVGHRINSSDVRSARGLFNLVGQVVGDPSLVNTIDTGARTQMMATIYREAIALGVPEAIDLIIQRSAANDRSAIYGLTYSIADAVQMADLKTLNTMIDQLGRDAILAAVPDAIAMILAMYRYPLGTEPAAYPARWTELDTLLQRLQPNWAYTQRGSQQVINLGMFTRASPDAQSLMRMVEEYQVALLIAADYPRVVLADLARQMYPLTVF